MEASSPTETSVAAKMRAAFLLRPERVQTRVIDVPRPQADEVLVEVRAVGVCGSDVHYFDHGHIGDYVPDGPLILGHEAAGVIVEVGEDVDRSRVGQRVSIEPQTPCRRCEQCARGRYNLCPDIVFLATPPHHGAFAQYLTVLDDFAHEIPDEMSLEAAALCEPLSVGIWAAQKAGIEPGSRVLISGAGPIGIIIAQVARAFGASEVFVADPLPERRDIAARFGATHTIDPSGEDPAVIAADVDAYIDASGSARALSAGIHAVARAGRVVLVGSGALTAELPVTRIQVRELVVTGVFRYAHTWPRAIQMIASGQVDLDALVTHVFGLDQTAAALRAGKDPRAIKAVVYPQRSIIEQG